MNDYQLTPDERAIERQKWYEAEIQREKARKEYDPISYAVRTLAFKLMSQCNVADHDSWKETFEKFLAENYPRKTYSSRDEMLKDTDNHENYWKDLISLCEKFMVGRTGDSRWENISAELEIYNNLEV